MLQSIVSQTRTSFVWRKQFHGLRDEPFRVDHRRRIFGFRVSSMASTVSSISTTNSESSCSHANHGSYSTSFNSSPLDQIRAMSRS